MHKNVNKTKDDDKPILILTTGTTGAHKRSEQAFEFIIERSFYQLSGRHFEKYCMQHGCFTTKFMASIRVDLHIRRKRLQPR